MIKLSPIALLGSLFMMLQVVSWGPASALAQQVPSSQEEIQLSFAPVVKKAAPAVVNIFTSRVTRSRPSSPLFDDPFFKRFFGDTFKVPEKERKQNALGSGVIVDPSGLIITNHHVIAGADEIKVVLADRREFAAELIVDDEQTDLALLKVQSGDELLPFLELRDSDDIEVGDLVLAIGNPFGVGQTVTSGIVSALARTRVGISDFNFFIQTDAAINPGNSGGALVTMDGRLIGINSAIYSRSGGSIGIGFAVPSNMVRTIIASAGMGGRVVRPWLGFVGQDLSLDLAEGFGLRRPGGVVVNEVFKGGNAEIAGLKSGDVILDAGGQPVLDLESLRFRIATGKMGSMMPLRVWRRQKELLLEMKLDPAPDKPEPDQRVMDGSNPLAGAKVANLSPRLAEEIELQGAWSGVVVLGTYRGSPAARSGLKPRDIVVQVNKRRVESTEQLQSLLAEGGPRWQVQIERGGRLLSLDVTF
ncbi:DegQ family serine endoprotease [Limibacillus sp. MBR-115]|jgi:serine protease Do|uniref:DegQ family serine endoprotease n=1 Tax=Limibacillus sp. MBR-115 TaxID=3156465 RepID=UPI00339359E3